MWIERHRRAVDEVGVLNPTPGRVDSKEGKYRHGEQRLHPPLRALAAQAVDGERGAPGLARLGGVVRRHASSHPRGGRTRWMRRGIVATVMVKHSMTSFGS